MKKHQMMPQQQINQWSRSYCEPKITLAAPNFRSYAYYSYILNTNNIKYNVSSIRKEKKKDKDDKI